MTIQKLNYINIFACLFKYSYYVTFLQKNHDF